MTFFKSIFPRQSMLKMVLLLAGFAVPSWMAAQADEKPQLSDKVSEQVAALGKMLNDKQYDQLIDAADKLVAQARPNSFDVAYLSQMKVQAYLYKSAYAAAIVPLETALSLSERYKYFEKRGELELRWLLAQLYAQEASTEKNAEVKRAKYNKAYETVRRWLNETPKPTVEALLFSASILYSQATESTNTPDLARLALAESECRKALLLEVKPRDQVYTLLIATLQVQSSALITEAEKEEKTGNAAAAAEKKDKGVEKLMEGSKYLEILVQQNPNNSQYWGQLLNPYLIQAEHLKEGTLQRQDAYARAIITIERAQKAGFLKTQEDYYRLVGIYFNSNQFEGAIDLLESGLRDGRIDPVQKNWELLAQTYVQIRDEKKALKTYKEIANIFPKEGTIDVQIGNLLYNLDNYPEALKYMQSALGKGIPRPAPVQFFVAYLMFELKQLDEAKAAVDKALALAPDSREAKDLKQVVDDAIKDRDTRLNRNQPQQATAASNPTNKQA
jgi:tetratricopeptide (TPR) repeat protein